MLQMLPIFNYRMGGSISVTDIVQRKICFGIDIPMRHYRARDAIFAELYLWLCLPHFEIYFYGITRNHFVLTIISAQFSIWRRES